MQVYFSARPMRFGSKQIDWASSDDAFGRKHNMFRRAAIQSLEEDGSVTFQNGWRVENIDVVVFATGYKFSFPFLESSAVVNVSDNRYATLLSLATSKVRSFQQSDRFELFHRCSCLILRKISISKALCHL